jgi:O-methyltransferase
MSTRVKVTLTPEQETLLITLYAKAQPNNPLFFDPQAQDILNQVDYDFDQLRVPYKTVILVCQRAKKMDMVTQDFMNDHPGGTVLQLGCGLDSRFLRVDRFLRDGSGMDGRSHIRRQTSPGYSGRITDVPGRG